MAKKVRLINGKGDWDADPPTGASDADLYQLANDVIESGGVANKRGGDALVTESDVPGLSVKIAKGTIYVDNSTWEANSFDPKFYQVIADDDEELAVSSNSSGETRVDLVCQSVDKITTPNSTGSNVCDRVIVEGTPGEGAPALPDEHELLATLTLPDGFSEVLDSMIEDNRRQVRFSERFNEKRVTAITSSTTPTPNVDTTDILEITALAANAAIQAPTGTPIDTRPLFIRIKDNGVARTLSFNAIYRAVGVILPTTTIAGKTLYIGAIYNEADTKYDVIAVAQEY